MCILCLGKPLPPKLHVRVNGVRLEVPTVHRWLGIDWIGKPWPLRLRVRTSWPFVAVDDAPGCGCIMRLKRLWQRLRPKPTKKGCGCRSSQST